MKGEGRESVCGWFDLVSFHKYLIAGFEPSANVAQVGDNAHVGERGV